MKALGRSILFLILTLATLPLNPLAAQQPGMGPESPLPVDPLVRVGELDNGLRYYIRANERPEARAELRLVVNAGSILEEEDQRGLAHFVEHMAFNGTKHFERQELVEYLESIGMRFGPDLNAYTSFDETVYMLTIPTDSQEVVSTAFQILEDWATNVLFDPEEIDKERGVVIEEWRGRRGAQARVFDLQIPVVLQGSLYAERLPIGQRETLETAPPETLVRFYEKWYRPDLMAVIAVGDFDPDGIEEMIRRHFAHLAVPDSDPDRPVVPVPEHTETLFHTAADPELTMTRVEILNKQPARRVTTIRDYRQSLVERAFNGMLNARFAEIAQKPDAPFLAAFSGRGGFVRTADAYQMGAMVGDGGAERGLEALLVEAERVARHGFTGSELERYKLNQLRSLERAHAERERTNSAAYANAYVSHFLRGDPAPGIEFEYQVAQVLVPTITVEEVDRLAREWITEQNRVILVSGPEKPDVVMPGRSELRAVLAAVAGTDVDPYQDAVADEPLVARVPAPAAIVDRAHHEAVDVLEWRLANGVRVLLKATDFQDDEIVMRAYSPGGLSLASDDDYPSASFATEVVRASGLGPYNMVDLRRALAGKAASVSPLLSEMEHGLAGSASPKDLETLLQLAYLHFTEPRHDDEAVASLAQRLRAMLANRGADPNAAFGDTLQVTLAQHHPRATPPSVAMLDEIDFQLAHDFFRERFADASGFTFFFVGNLDLEAMEPLVGSYLGGLPASGSTESWRDTGVRPPEGVVEKVVRQGLEPRSMTRIVFTGPLEEYTLEQSFAVSALARVLSIRLREVLREDLGGTYGVSVNGSASSRPEPSYTFSVQFGADPERLDELTTALFEEIGRIKEEGPREQDLVRVRETQRRERETNLRQNGYWVGQLQAYDREGLDFADMLRAEDRIASLDAQMIQEAARAWLRTDRYVRVSLFPADHATDVAGDGGR
jgi:zinc protease